MRRSCLFLAAAVLSGCTHLDTTRDYSTGPALDQAVTGIPYALPDLHYEFQVDHSIASCPHEFVLAAEGGSARFWGGNLQFQTKVAASRHYVAGERFLADYQSLASFMKTSSYGLETYPSGVLKSLNVSAEDQTGPLIKDVVAIGLGVARIAAGLPSGAVAAEAPEGAQPASAIAGIAGAGPIASMGEALAALQQSAVNVSFPACRDSISRAQDALAAAASSAETATADLAKQTRQVARYSLIAANDRSVHADLEKLDGALAAQADAEDRLVGAKAALDGARQQLAFSETIGWTPRASGGPVPLAPGNPERLDKLLTVKTAPVVQAAAFDSVWKRMSPDLKTMFRAKFADVAKAYGVFERDPPAEPGLAEERLQCSSGSIRDCVTPGLTLYAMLVAQAAPNVTGVPRGAHVVHPSAAKASPGLFVRSQQLADLNLCVGQADVARCDAPSLVLEERGVPVPQLGQLRFLPFSNGPFEAAKLSLEMAEDGSISKFSYDRTKAISSGSEVVKDAISQYESYRETREKDRTDALARTRAEQIAGIQQQIDVLTKQKELIKLQAPPEDDPNKLVVAETASIEAQVALLNAQLSRLKAEAALAEASSGTK